MESISYPLTYALPAVTTPTNKSALPPLAAVYSPLTAVAAELALEVLKCSFT